MEITKRKELATYLRWGDITNLAKLAGVDKSTIHLWLNGKVKKSTAQPFIIALVKKRKEEIDRLVNAETSN